MPGTSPATTRTVGWNQHRMAQLALLLSQMVNQQEAHEEKHLRLDQQKMEQRIDNEGAREAERVAAAAREAEARARERELWKEAPT